MGGQNYIKLGNIPSIVKNLQPVTEILHCAQNDIFIVLVLIAYLIQTR